MFTAQTSELCRISFKKSIREVLEEYVNIRLFLGAGAYIRFQMCEDVVAVKGALEAIC